ncbi:DUF4440 domain-containing protein [Allomuricauda sp. SCSIO 65647]|uniref:YybH family protein n=1 Tax=Allomuricauda sp. SCSIO 65647 TaxID=2908843 RepID=UPI001F464B3A|nr:DUF4440 domain-containing protein [Muricauda sp. SCSIO 65647]UJH68313.1 DUF4440 domain-containing protein [Muricauda sp. SCSIO 65647]
MIQIVKTIMPKALFYTVLIGSLLLTSCKQKENEVNDGTDQVDMSVLKKEIASRLRDYENNLRNGDSIALGAMYMEDAEIIPSTVGRENIVKAFGAMIRDGITGSSFKTVGLWGNDQLLVEEGTGEWSHESGQVVGRGRYLLVWQKDNGEWKILRDTWFPEKTD